MGPQMAEAINGVSKSPVLGPISYTIYVIGILFNLALYSLLYADYIKLKALRNHYDILQSF